MKILIKNGRVVTPRGTCAADVLIEGSRIAQVGEGLSESGCNLYDAAGCLLFPGFIDAHTHLDMDNGVTVSSDDFETGTAAAVCGGTTTILDFATQDRGGPLAKALADWHTKSDGKASCDYGFHMAITDWNDEVSREIDGMAQAGVTSFKLYLAYDNLRLPDGQVYEVLKRVHQIGGIVGTHCENGDLINELAGELRRAGKLSPRYHPFARPDYVEAEAIARYCYIALAADAPVNIVHLSTRLGLEEARRAREQDGVAALAVVAKRHNGAGMRNEFIDNRLDTARGQKRLIADGKKASVQIRRERVKAETDRAGDAIVRTVVFNNRKSALRRRNSNLGITRYDNCLIEQLAGKIAEHRFNHRPPVEFREQLVALKPLRLPGCEKNTSQFERSAHIATTSITAAHAARKPVISSII